MPNLPTSPLFSLMLLLLLMQGGLVLIGGAEMVGLSQVSLVAVYGLGLALMVGDLRRGGQQGLPLALIWFVLRLLVEGGMILADSLDFRTQFEPDASTPLYILTLAFASNAVLLGLMGLQMPRHGGIKVALDAMTVVLTLAVAAWALGLAEIMTTFAERPLEQTLFWAYVVSCLWLSVFAFMLIMRKRVGPVGMALAAGAVSSVAGDLVFGIEGAVGLAWLHQLSALFYSFSGAFIAYAATTAGAQQPPDTSDEISPTAAEAQHLPYVAAVFACAVLVTNLPHGSAREQGIIWGTAGLIALIMLRQWFSGQEEMQLRRELRASSKQVEHRAYHDSLTGLPNRAALDKMFQEDENLCSGMPYAIFSTDLNGFKYINDTHGHQVGDMMLTHAAQQLQRAVAHPGRVFRWGGDEFVIVMPGVTHEADARALAEFIRMQIATPMDYKGQKLQVGTSIGYTLGRGAANYEILLSMADSGMYKHKQRGAPVRGKAVDKPSA